MRYLIQYSFLTYLAKQSAKRDHKLFTELTSNIDRHILSEGLFEKGVIDLLADLVQKVGHRQLMIDIGANIGNHTVALAPYFDRVESVEPHPVLFRVLTANVLRNRFSHVNCHNFGLANEDTTGTLAEPSDNHSIARVRERSQLPPETFGLSSEEFGEEFTVDLKSASEFVGQFSEQLPGAFIKIDVEGMETEIVTALIDLIAEFKPLVGFEWFSKSQPELGRMAAELPGYELWGIRVHDQGNSLVWRAVKLLFSGRTYTLEQIDLANVDTVYPLAMMIPAGKMG